MKLLSILVLLAPLAMAQQSATGDMKVRVNYINVCAPSDADRQEIAAALAKIPAQPHFAADYEVSRGRSSDSEAGSSDYVRLRREAPGGSLLSTVQYSISVDPKAVIETTVFRWRDPKDVLQVSLEDSATAGGPQAVLAADTPVSHIRVERFGKNSLAVARCPGADQAALEPLFASASTILSRYRAALGVRQTVPGELGRLGIGAGARKTEQK